MASIQLRRYQEQALEHIQAAYWGGITRQLLVLPTGSGKTRVVGHLPEYLPVLPMVMLENTINLVDQTADALRAVNPALRVEIERAEFKAQLNADIVVASVQTLANGKKCQRCAASGRSKHCPRCAGVGKFLTRLQDWPANHFRTAVCDEVHHAEAVSYQLLFGRTHGHFKPALLLGCTATPGRTDGKDLAHTFDACVFERTYEQLVLEGERDHEQGPYLCRAHPFKVQSTERIDDVGIGANGDFQQGKLAARVNTDDRNTLICNAIEQHCEGLPDLGLAPRKSIIVFCVDQHHARTLTAQLQVRGHEARCLIQKTPEKEKPLIIEGFRQRDFRILVSVNMVLEGSDFPSADCAVMARPTKSPVVFAQAIGRVVRPFPGKTEAIVIDVVDVCGRHEVMTAAKYFGCGDLDLKGKDALAAKQRVRELVSEGTSLTGALTLEELEERHRLARECAQGIRTITTLREATALFAAAEIPKEVASHSSFAWLRLSQDRYILSINRTPAELWRDPVGEWFYRYSTDPAQSLGHHTHTPFAEADRLAKHHIPADFMKVMKIQAAWRKQPATDFAPYVDEKTGKTKYSQLYMLRNFFHIRALPPGLNRGSASTLLDYLYLRRSFVAPVKKVAA